MEAERKHFFFSVCFLISSLTLQPAPDSSFVGFSKLNIMYLLLIFIDLFSCFNYYNSHSCMFEL